MSRFRFVQPLWIVTLVLMIAGETTSVSHCAESVAELDRLDDVLAGFEKSRQLLTSADWRASGHVRISKAGKVDCEGEVAVRCAVDYLRDRFRFDRRQAEIMVRSPRGKDAAGNTAASIPDQAPDRVVEIMEDRCIQSAESIAIWTSMAKTQVTVRNPTDLQALSGARPFDVRQVGWTVGALLHGRSFSKYVDAVSALRHRRFTSLVRDKEGIWKLECVSSKQQLLEVRFVYWIDEQRGYTPVHFEMYWRFGPPKEADNWGEPVVVSDTTWSQVNDVFVPATFSIVDRANTADEEVQYSLAFEWNLVNGPLSDGLFDADALPMGRSAKVVDYRLGKPVQTKVIGATSGKLPPTAVPKSQRTKLWFVVGLNIFFLLIAFLGLPVRRWLRGKSRIFDARGAGVEENLDERP